MFLYVCVGVHVHICVYLCMLRHWFGTKITAVFEEFEVGRKAGPMGEKRQAQVRHFSVPFLERRWITWFSEICMSFAHVWKGLFLIVYWFPTVLSRRFFAAAPGTEYCHCNVWIPHWTACPLLTSRYFNGWPCSLRILELSEVASDGLDLGKRAGLGWKSGWSESPWHFLKEMAHFHQSLPSGTGEKWNLKPNWIFIFHSSKFVPSSPFAPFFDMKRAFVDHLGRQERRRMLEKLAASVKTMSNDRRDLRPATSDSSFWVGLEMRKTTESTEKKRWENH